MRVDSIYYGPRESLAEYIMLALHRRDRRKRRDLRAYAAMAAHILMEDSTRPWVDTINRRYTKQESY